MSSRHTYLHHTLACAPREFAAVAERIGELDWAGEGGNLYGAWRSQIGRPRDELNVMTVWSELDDAARVSKRLRALKSVNEVKTQPMQATLRPTEAAPPQRQGNYAFRWFELPSANWTEFLELCAGAWPGFESAYDSQVIGLWRCLESANGQVRALLLTRRPDLAMWERSKKPANAREAEVRKKLSRRYDLCDATEVYTTTLLTASDEVDEVRWA